jgi:DNA-binding response OmpR family regulator
MMQDGALKILIVDDESTLRESLTRSFQREGHAPFAVPDGRAAIDRATTHRFDVVLLDVALGHGPDGYEVCRVLRERHNTVPIIMLTALDSEADTVLGLEAGADDYVGKPVGLAELRSRIRAVLRRAGPRVQDVLQAGPLKLTRQELMRAIWGDSAFRDPRGIDVHVRHLREKLEKTPERPELILTVRGAGYRLAG